MTIVNELESQTKFKTQSNNNSSEAKDLTPNGCWRDQMLYVPDIYGPDALWMFQPDILWGKEFVLTC